MNSFYSSDEDVAWGQVTTSEIKRHMKGQVRKKPHKRHSISNISHNSKEPFETSILNDVTNKSNIFITNDTFKGGTIHVQPAMMLDNFPATMENNTVLSEDAGYDVSVLSSKDDVYGVHKDESLIIISDDDSEENFRAGKYEGLLNCQGNTSDYYENYSMKKEDDSKEQLNCISLLSTDEDTKEGSLSIVRDYHVTLPDNDPERNSEHSILLEKEVSPQIPESCRYILENKMDSLACQDCQSGNEIQLMPQLDYESARTEISVNSDEQHYDFENTPKGLNVSRNSLCNFATEEDTEEKSTDRDYQNITVQDKPSDKNSEHSIILEKEVSQQIQDPSENKKDSVVYLDRQSVNEIELTQYDESVGDGAYHPKSDNSSEQCDVLENTHKDLNVSEHYLSKLNSDMNIILNVSIQSNSTPQTNIKVDVHVENNLENEYVQNHKSGGSDDVLEYTHKDLNVSEHYLSKSNSDMNIILNDSIQSNSTPQKNIKVDVHVENDHENEYFQNHKSGGSDDVLENTHKDLNVSEHYLSKLNSDVNIILNGSTQSNSTPQKNINVDVHVENDHENEYFQNHKSGGSAASNMNRSNDSGNREELNNTLDMVERMLEGHVEIQCQSVDKQNNTNSTSLSASKDKSRIPKLLKSPQIGDTFKVPQTSQKQKSITPKSKSASKYKFKDVVSPVGLYIKYSPKPILKQNINSVEFKSPVIVKKMATSPQISKPIRSISQDIPTAIYKPSKKQVTSSAKKLFLPPSLERMVQKSSVVKHEGQRNCPHNESHFDRLLLTESELTRCSISDSIVENTSQDISVLTVKNALK